MDDARGPVLVTGGSGFIAGHCILQLLEQGHRVRATIRSLEREPEARRRLESAGVDPAAELSFVPADLQSDDGWAEAVDGCAGVLHVASPLPHGAPKHEDDLIVPAREGTLRVLRAARTAGVGRVVLTSAFHTVGFGWGRDADRSRHTFTEDDWSRLDGPGIDAYGKSKTLAERAAWAWADESRGAAGAAIENASTELTVLNPVAVVGPGLGGPASGANELVRRILTGALPGYPNLWIPIVDVRDVAIAHAAALTNPAAAGQRFLLSSGSGLTLREIGMLLKRELGDQARRVPTRSLPDFVVRLGGRFNPELRGVAADLGVVKQVSTAKAERLLGWQGRAPEISVLDAARSML